MNEEVVLPAKCYTLTAESVAEARDFKKNRLDDPVGWSWRKMPPPRYKTRQLCRNHHTNLWGMCAPERMTFIIVVRVGASTRSTYGECATGCNDSGIFENAKEEASNASIRVFSDYTYMPSPLAIFYQSIFRFRRNPW